MSPVSPSYAGGGMGGASASYSPHHMQSPQGVTGKTPAYGSTPLYGYTSSPAYGSGASGYGGDAAMVGYSPGGAS